MILSYLTGLLGGKGKSVRAQPVGLPAELQFPVYIAGDGGSGRSTALAEIARRANLDRRIIVTFSVKSHLAAGAGPSDRAKLAAELVSYVEAVAVAATQRIIVLVDDIDRLDQQDVQKLLATSARADLVLTCSGHFLSGMSDVWRQRQGSVVALHTSPPALAQRLEAEGAPVTLELLATLRPGESYQVDLATCRVAALSWPWSAVSSKESIW